MCWAGVRARRLLRLVGASIEGGAFGRSTYWDWGEVTCRNRTSRYILRHQTLDRGRWSGVRGRGRGTWAGVRGVSRTVACLLLGGVSDARGGCTGRGGTTPADFFPRCCAGPESAGLYPPRGGCFRGALGKAWPMSPGGWDGDEGPGSCRPSLLGLGTGGWGSGVGGRGRLVIAGVTGLGLRSRTRIGTWRAATWVRAMGAGGWGGLVLSGVTVLGLRSHTRIGSCGAAAWSSGPCGASLAWLRGGMITGTLNRGYGCTGMEYGSCTYPWGVMHSCASGRGQTLNGPGS